jgi:N-acetylglucosamine kinase-like BadF-type ATPase
MNNPLSEHIYRVLNQRHGSATKLAFLAELVVNAALKGDMLAAKICFDALECFDSSMVDVDEED